MLGRKKTLIGIIFASLFLVGAWAFIHYAAECFAGGGGSEHTPPPAVTFGSPIELKLELNRWAAPQCLRGKTSEAFSDVKCHYRLKGDHNYQILSMQLVNEDKTRAYYECMIPALAKNDIHDFDVEYFFDFKMNEVYSRRDEKPLVPK